MSNVREHARILQKAGIVIAGVAVSRVLGLVRDATIAAKFDIEMTDAFFVAFAIPNTLRVLLGEGAASGAFVPVLNKVHEQEGLDRAREYLSALTLALTAILVVTTVAGIVASPTLVRLYADGYDPGRAAVTTLLTRLCFPYVLFVCLATLATSSLNTLGKYSASAIAPAALNVALIVAALLVRPISSFTGLPAITVLGFGVIVGGFLHVALQVPSLLKLRLLAVPKWSYFDHHVRTTFRLLLPLFVSLGVYQVNVLLSRRFASHLPAGAQSYLYYAQRLVEVPQGMFTFALISAALPTMSALRARGDQNEVIRTFGYGLRLTTFVSIPSILVLYFFAEPIVTILLRRGSFGAIEVAGTQSALQWLALGILGAATSRTVVPLFHVHNDTLTPVIGAIANLVVFVVAAKMLMPYWGHNGIACATALGATAQLGSLLVLARATVGRIGFRAIMSSSVRCMIAGSAATIVCLLLERWMRPLGDDYWAHFCRVAVLLPLFLIAYLMAARTLRSPEVTELRQVFYSRNRLSQRATDAHN